ncbi:MAG: cobalamin-binding protein [Sphingobacteriales bacterium]|nr:MAG: cobalamin-binding protein [Sphingobacteriales bacterium]
MLLSVTDMLGRELQVPEQPLRIVSLVPSQTELLADLGLDAEVVGITKFCVHPESWFRTKARVGGTKDVKPERVAALHPDLILANKEENVQAQVDALSGIAPVWVSDIHTLADALTMIRQVGGLVGRKNPAQTLAQRIETGFATLQKSLVPERVAYAIWRDPWMWAGGDTFIHDLLERCGWENVFSGTPRYPEVSLEALALLQPDRVLLSSEPYPFREKHLTEIQAVVPNAIIQLVDGELFSWYGSRLQYSPAYFQQLLNAAGGR